MTVTSSGSRLAGLPFPALKEEEVSSLVSLSRVTLAGSASGRLITLTNAETSTLLLLLSTKPLLLTIKMLLTLVPAGSVP